LAPWQKRLRYAIAVFVVAFAAIVAVSMRRGRPEATGALVPEKAPGGAVLYSPGEGTYTVTKDGKPTYSIKFGNQATFSDNRSKFGGGVTVVLPDKEGRQVTIQSQDAEVTTPPGRELGSAVFGGGVSLVTSDGLTVKTATATYTDEDQVTRIPGPLTFAKGRMTGSGVGATYDQARNVLWILDQAKVDVAADEKGAGEVHAASKTAGMARSDHYTKFVGEARLEGEGREIAADDITAYLTEDDERITRMELRGSAVIRARPGASGPQEMRAKDIDLAYAEDGRTLQSAHLSEDASVQLAAENGRAGRRVAGKVIDVAMAPDGATLTNLSATENAQVDLPAAGDTPARRIRSATLVATGAAGKGIQAATFAGSVEFRETRAATGALAAIDRTAKADRLEVATAPGFGDIEKATFHNHVHFTDGTHTTAEAPTAVYAIAQDRLELTPGAGDKGRGPHVSDGRVSVEALTIQMTLGAQRIKADTNVRTVMISQSKPKPGSSAVRMPAMLEQDQPVNVTSNRLDYDSAKSVAIYEGNSRLWQDPDTLITADRLVLEDRTGNLRATTKVVTSMVLTLPSDQAADPKKARTDPTNITANELLYEDGKRQASYTGGAHMSGPSGDVTAARIDLFLAEKGGQLERAEADGDVVSRQDARRAYGRHLTYDAKTDDYTMTGAPVKIYEDTPPDCKMSEGTTATFKRSGNTMAISGTLSVPHKSAKVPCGSGPGLR
jgi:lipopolysaccharide export system protein LptA